MGKVHATLLEIYLRLDSMKKMNEKEYTAEGRNNYKKHKQLMTNHNDLLAKQASDDQTKYD